MGDMSLDYTGQPVVVLEWSTLPRAGDAGIEFARQQFNFTMSILRKELNIGGRIVGFHTAGVNPTRYTVLIERALKVTSHE